MERRTPWLGYLCVILSAVIFGCMPLGANFLYAQGVTPMSLVFLRCCAKSRAGCASAAARCSRPA